MRGWCTRLLSLVLALGGLGSMGCARNAASFYEGTRFAFVIEYNPASNQPVNFTLGYKRRIVAIVPPQEPAPPTLPPTGQPPSPAPPPQPAHKGDALSLVSSFDVEGAGVMGATIKNTFASGFAARDMTEGADADEKIKGLFAPASFTRVDKVTQQRKDALQKTLGTLDNQRAGRILRALGLEERAMPGCQDREAICILQDEISRAPNEATVTRLESAFARGLLSTTP